MNTKLSADSLLSIKKRQKLEGQIYQPLDHDIAEEILLTRSPHRIEDFNATKIFSNVLHNKKAFGIQNNEDNLILYLWQLFPLSGTTSISPFKLTLKNQNDTIDDISQQLFSPNSQTKIFRNIDFIYTKNGFECICCLPNGLVHIFNVNSKNLLVDDSLLHTIKLNDDGEFITCAIHTGEEYFIFGTSFGNIIISHQSDNSEMENRINSHILKREKASFLGLMKSFIFRNFDDEHVENRSITNIFHIHIPSKDILFIPSKDILFCIGNISSIWNQWKVPNDEIFKDFNLKQILLNDIRTDYSNQCHFFEIVGCELVLNNNLKKEGNTYHSQSNSVYLCVLSTVSADSNETENYLWLHMIELCAHDNNNESTMIIRSRMLISSNMKKEDKTSVLVNTNDDSKLFISWSEKSSNLSSSTTVSIVSTTKTQQSLINDILVETNYTSDSYDSYNDESILKVLFINTNNLPLLAQSGQNDDAVFASRHEYFESTDTGLPISIISCRTVQSNDNNYVIILKNGDIINCHIKEAVRKTLPHQLSILETQPVSISIDEIKIEIKTVITEMLNENDANSFLITKIRSMLVRIPIDEALEVIQSISQQILTVSTTGQHWNTMKITTSSSNNNSDKIDMTGSHYQLVHRVLESKLRTHLLLIKIVFALEIINERSINIQLGKNLNKSIELTLLSNHQYLLASYGFCSSIQMEVRSMYINMIDKKSSSIKTLSNTSMAVVTSSTTGGTRTRTKSDGRKSQIFAMQQSINDDGFDVISPMKEQFQSNTNINLELCHQKAVQIINEGLEYTVQAIWKMSKSEYESKGLSAIDIFFNDILKFTDGFSGVCYSVEKYISNTDSNTDETILTLFYSLIFLLSSIEQTLDGAGSSSYQTSFICHDGIRQSLLHILNFLSCLIKGKRQSSNDFTLGQIEILTNEESVCGNKLKELTYHILQSYISEAKAKSIDSTNNSTAIIPEVWKQNFQHAKKTCIDLLLDLGHSKTAFQYSKDYLYFAGIMESYKYAVELEDYKLNQLDINDRSKFNINTNTIFSNFIWNEIFTLLQKKGKVLGSEDICMAEYVMTWLEVHNRPNLILKLSSIVNEEFLKFINVRLCIIKHVYYHNIFNHYYYIIIVIFVLILLLLPL